MVEVSTEQKEVKIVREFAGMEASEEYKKLRIIYKEETIVNGEVIKSENKEYLRDYDYWKASQLGVAIIGMVELDLALEYPSAPTEVIEP